MKKEHGRRNDETVNYGSLQPLLNEAELKPEEAKALAVLDNFAIPVADKRILLAGFIFVRAGVFRTRDVLGFTPDQSVNARDRVITNPHYESLWSELNFLVAYNFLDGEGYERLSKKHPGIADVLALKNQGFTNKQVAEQVARPIGHIDNLTRALVFLQILPANKSRIKEVESQNELMHQIVELRRKGVGNYAIAQRLYLPIDRIEEAARFLVWTGLVDPISKSDASIYRYDRDHDYKDDVRTIISPLDRLKRVSVRKLHQAARANGLSIGYEKFLRLYQEITQEQQTPPIEIRGNKV